MVPLLFLLYVNDLKIVSNILDPIIFADDTNLFLDTNVLDIYFKIVNQVLENIKQWFVSNVSHFSLKEGIPPLLQKLIINN